jgi:uncharacterized protein (DUF305 family)
LKKLFLILAGALLVSGCVSAPQANSKFSADDINFAEMMIPHHEGAIKMAQEVATSESKEVADLSASIINAQELEISKMKEILAKF